MIHKQCVMILLCTAAIVNVQAMDDQRKLKSLAELQKKAAGVSADLQQLKEEAVSGFVEMKHFMSLLSLQMGAHLHSPNDPVKYTYGGGSQTISVTKSGARICLPQRADCFAPGFERECFLRQQEHKRCIAEAERREAESSRQ